jgi:2-polyprenyl-3-methyl-5-hydroxy-6-metoxy-1,4-benzoquinol methylase
MLRSKLFRRPMENYKGLHVGCAPGTHAAVVSMVSEHIQQRGGVLDIGAHSGALLHRFKDAGFSDLAAADFDTTVFNVPGVPLTRIDANQPFAQLFDRKFNLITCTDIIEHLDSPRHFFAEARQLLNDDGHIAFSVPNVAFWEGRVKFALKGELWGFGRRNYMAQRHISPLTIDQAELLMREIGYKPVAWTTQGTFATPARRLVLSPLWLPFYILDRKRTLGESLIFLAQKAPPEQELKSPWDYRERWEASDQVARSPSSFS